MRDYSPIDCGLHDELQLRALRRRACDIESLGDDGAIRRHHGTLVDVFARDGAEYLKLADGTEIRLDHLVRVDGVDFGADQRR